MKIIFLLQNIHNIVLASHNGSGKDESQKQSRNGKNKEAKYGLHEMHFLDANNCFWAREEKAEQKKPSE